MKGHRDSPEIEPDEADDGPMNPSRRFARLVRSPAARKIAMPRLIAAGGVALLIVWLLWMLGARFIHSTIDWVNHLPDQKIAFARIELRPEPPSFIKSGTAGILEEVRIREKYDREVSLLDLDLDVLRNGFKHCPWVREVGPIVRSHGHLEVHLAFRTPVAAVEIDHDARKAQVFDEETVPLPHVDIDWISEKHPFRVQGIPDPLIEFLRAKPRSDPKVGVPWVKPINTASPDHDDLMFLAGARLAAFIQARPKTTPLGRKAPTFVSIWLPDEPNGSFWLMDAEDNVVQWGKAPGEEKPGDSTGDDRWKMLLDWVDHHEPLRAISPDCLRFNKTEAELILHKGSKKASGKSP